MRTIKLEILRDGPPHNQLLSPLTGYLALCGEHPPSTFRLPFGHAQWLARLGSMTYRDSSQTRQLNLQDLSATMASLLEQVPGLVAELAKCEATNGNTSTGRAMVHFRLVHNANELALLPFELANAPAGFPTQGQSLALQTLVPLCITREVRRAPTQDWIDCKEIQPRILFAFAEPAAPVPYKHHLLALRQCIDPWVCHWSKDRDPEARRKVIDECLTVLPFATLARLKKACESGTYTHVHILAHGAEFNQAEDHRFGLALHGSHRTEVDRVDGERLATALRTHVEHPSQSLACPFVVTLASCDSGNAGTVIGAGSSVAHELHVKGIPLVIGSQYPLTVKGSIRLVQILYDDFLWGRDPRCAVDKLRRDLQTSIPESHDWASIVAYASLPADIDQRCSMAQYHRASLSINVALKLADQIAGDWCNDNTSERAKTVLKNCQAELALQTQPAQWLGQEPMRKLKEARAQLEGLLQPYEAPDQLEICGRLAAAHKRTAEVLLNLSARVKESEQARAVTVTQARGELMHAIQHYRNVFARKSDHVWGEVQSLVLECVLGERTSSDAWRQRWGIARDLSEVDLKRSQALINSSNTALAIRPAWACGNLIELWLIAHGLGWSPEEIRPVFLNGVLEPGNEPYVELTRKYAKRLQQVATAPSVEMRSTRHQLRRYVRSFHYLMTNLAPKPQDSPAVLDTFGQAQASESEHRAAQLLEIAERLKTSAEGVLELLEP